MTPDTSAYMVAGFVVILGGIFIYTISILVRIHQYRDKIERIRTIGRNQTEALSAPNKDEYEN